MAGPSDTIPFAPRVAPGVVGGAAVVAAALALLPVASWMVHALQRGVVERIEVPVRAIAVPAVLGGFLLALVVARTQRTENTIHSCLAGGVATGIACAVYCACTPGGPPLDGPSLALGVFLGLVYGAACLYPAAELHAARDPHAHAATDVQLSNTAAWIAALSTGGFFAALTVVTWWSTAALATTSLAVAIGARIRHGLRRRWLKRVLSGQVPGWTIDSSSDGMAEGPIVELLEASADERFVVAVGADNGIAYRDSRRAAVRGRLTPNW